MIKENSVGAIVFRRGAGKIEYLLLRYESGHWDFARGHVERGETETETAKREIEEETGLKNVNFISGFRFSISWNYRKRIGDKSVMSNKTVVLYLAETKTHHIKISDEHVDYEWLPYEKAVKCLTFPKSKKVLEEAQRFLMKKEGLAEK